MPKVHSLGQKYFAQYIDFPVNWGTRMAVRGWTQEIEEPFRTAKPVIIRLPFHKALVFGRWNGQVTEEEALSRAIERRELTNDDFSEEKGWIPAPDQTSEEDSWYTDA